MPINDLPPPPEEMQAKSRIADLPPPPYTTSPSTTSDLPPPPSEAPAELEKGTGIGGYLTAEDIDRVAAKHGADPKEIARLAPYFAISSPREEEVSLPENLAKQQLGQVGRVLGNVPQKAFLLGRATPENRAALEELQSIGEEQRGLPSELLEAAALPIPALKGAGLVKAGARVAAAAGIGGAFGYGHSKQGEEVSGAVKGLVSGAVLGMGAEALGRIVSKAGKTYQDIEREVIENTIRREAPALEGGTEKVLLAQQESNAALERAILGDSEKLTPEAANSITEQQLDPDFVRAALDPATTEGQMVRSRIGDADLSGARAEQIIRQNLADDFLEKQSRDFAEQLTGTRPADLAEARSAIRDYSERQGAEATADKYRLMVEENAARKYIEANGIRGGRGDNFGNASLNFVSDAQFVLRDIDEKFGSNLEPIHRDWNRDYNRMTFARDYARREIDRIYRANRDVDETVTGTDKIYRALDTGDFSNLSPAEQKIAADFRKFFDDQLHFVNELIRSKDPHISPLSIPKRENYVPHLMLRGQELTTAAGKELEYLGSLAERAYGKPLQALSGRELAEVAASDTRAADLLRGLELFDNRIPKSGADLLARFHDAFESRTGRIRMSTEAKAALERTGDIPTWMRETNLYRLADRWSSNTLRHLYLRRTVDQLASAARRLDSAGAALEARYVRTLVEDINGVRPRTSASFTREVVTRWQSAMDRAAEHAGTPVARAAAIVGKAIPEIVTDFGRQIYSNLLGLNPKAIIQNAMQPFLKTSPELGGGYGLLTVLRGTIHALGNFRRQLELVNRLGLAPAEFTSKFQRAISDGIRRSATYAIPSQVLQGMADASLKLYSGMDAINRAITLSTAQMMAHDLARGSRGAQKALAKFPSSLQRQVGRATSPEQVAELLASHLNASTQYNYNRASMSEFGRTMGPLFSIFSKWPTATAGEIIQEMRSGALKGSLRNAEKYLAPLLALKVADYFMAGGQSPEEGFSDRQKKLFGRTGIAQAAPIGSLEGIMRGDFFTPPAVDALMQGAILPMMAGDPDKFQKGLANSIQQWTPGSVYVRFITDDLVTYLTGSRPEGTNFLERTAEGARQWTK